MSSYPMPRPNPFIRVALALIGALGGRVELDAVTMSVRLGIGFRATVPRSSITAAVPLTGHRFVSIGAHGWRGRWLVNTTTRNLVKLTINPPGRCRCLGIPANLRELWVSLEGPDAFLRDLGHGT